jgi:hypothetical protein
MMGTRIHRGTGFEVWTSQQSWFWRVATPCRNGGTVGAAASEADAVSEACTAIDEMPSCSPGIDSAARGWEGALADLGRYLCEPKTCAGASV